MSNSMMIKGIEVLKYKAIFYLGSTGQKNGGFKETVDYGIKIGQMRWMVPRISGDNRITIRLKAKRYKKVALPAMLYGTKC